MTTSPRWVLQGACARPSTLSDLMTDDMDGVRGSLRITALRHRDELVIAALCGRCPVREACLEADLAHPTPDRHHVRGGMTAAERRALRAARARAVAS